LKSFYHLEGFPSQNPQIVHALIYSAVITLLVSLRLEHALRQRIAANPADASPANQTLFPLLRLAAVLTAVSADLLQAVLQQAGLQRAPLRLTDLILREAQDPNRKRDTLPRLLQKI
jgi:putative transposase